MLAVECRRDTFLVGKIHGQELVHPVSCDGQCGGMGFDAAYKVAQLPRCSRELTTAATDVKQRRKIR